MKTKTEKERVNKKQKRVLFYQSRDNKVIELLKNGVSYIDIAAQMGISKQRVQQLAKRNGISRWKESSERKLLLEKNIRSDIKAGFSYKELKLKYDSGLVGIGAKFRESRNINIVKKYETKTANTVLGYTNKVFVNPDKINTVSSVYHIATKSGFKKYPMIGNRSAGGTFEKPKILKLIVDKRDNKKMGFMDIAKLLNNKGLKTITGKEFNASIVFGKYKSAKRNKI